MDKVQPVADAIHVWSGLDCIQQARAASAVCAALWLGVLILGQAKHHTFNFGAALCTLVGVQRAFYENAADALARSSSSCARNPRRLCLVCRVERLLYGGLAVFAFPFVAFGALFPLVAASMWIRSVLEACDVQTPRKGRIRESFQRLAASMRSRLIPEPSNQPA